MERRTLLPERTAEAIAEAAERHPGMALAMTSASLSWRTFGEALALLEGGCDDPLEVGEQAGSKDRAMPDPLPPRVKRRDLAVSGVPSLNGPHCVLDAVGVVAN